MNFNKFQFVFFIILFMGTSQLFAQTPSFAWVKQMGLGGTDVGLESVVDDLGNIYTTGHYQGPVDFDPGNGTSELIFNGGRDIFIQKLDANGNYIWSRQFGGNQIDIGNAVAIDKNRNVYVTGLFRGTVDFDPDTTTTAFLTSNGDGDIFVLKLDQNGNYLWAKNMGGLAYDTPYSLALDTIGNVYVAGYFRDSADFDPGSSLAMLYANGTDDIFIAKLDQNGNYAWAKGFGGGSPIQVKKIVCDQQNNVFLTGYYYGTVDFDPGVGTSNLSSNGNSDIFLVKLNANGNLVWANSKGWNFNDEGIGLATDSRGNLYSTGFFLGTVDFEPGSGITNISSGATIDGFVQKLDPAGNLIWAKKFGGSGQTKGQAITLDALGNIYVTGVFKTTANFNTTGGAFNMTSAGFDDVFIMKLDSSGRMQWAKKIGGTEDDKSYSIVVDHSQNIYTTGYFKGTADFDPDAGVFNLTSPGLNEDIYIHKIFVSPVGLEQVEAQSEINVYPNPTAEKAKIFFKKEYSEVKLTLMNNLGAIVLNTTYHAVSEIEVEIPGYSGVYFLQIENSNGEILNKKIIKH